MRTGQNPAQVVDGQASIDQRDERDDLVRIGSAAELADSRFGARDARAESEDLGEGDGEVHGVSPLFGRSLVFRLSRCPSLSMQKPHDRW